MEQFCIVTNRSKDETFSTTEWLVEYLRSKGKKVCVAEITDGGHERYYTQTKDIPDGTECVIVLGGDGTLLKTAHDLRELQVPLFGINLGTLGFLAETELNSIEPALNDLFENNYTIESRMMLSMTAHGHSKDGQNILYALNDVVITRSGFSRLIRIRVYVNGEFVNEYRGDGIIISTPTGSTGYNLSAGGPVVTPKTELMIITPICPHSLNTRSIIVSSDDVVSVKICEGKKTQDEEAIVTIDGNELIYLQAEDVVEIRKASCRTQLVKLPDINFFDILRKKLSV